LPTAGTYLLRDPFRDLRGSPRPQATPHRGATHAGIRDEPANTNHNHRLGERMTVLTANGSGTGRWSLLKKLATALGKSKTRAKPGRADEAYNDYWKVRSHRTPSVANAKRS